MKYLICTFIFISLALTTPRQADLYATENVNYKYASITSSDGCIAPLEAQFYQIFKISEICHRVKTIVIDPGHGGKDHGCHGHGAIEKNLCLSLGLKLRNKMRTAYPDIEVVMTRASDIFIPLHERAKIANDHHADLFVSIHCNSSSSNSKASGSETYVLGLHRAKDNLNVAKRENASILLEANYRSFYGGFDPNAPETHILLSMFQNVHLDQSILLADLIERQAEKHNHLRSRGVKQAGFAVLRLTTMPSILFETGFLSNKEDARYLKSDAGSEQTVDQLFTAIQSYQEAYEKDCEQNIPRPTLTGVVAVKKDEQSHASPATAEHQETLYWSIQLAAVAEELDKVPSIWLDLPTIYACKFDNCTKYYAGRFQERSGLEESLDKIKKEVSQGAFVVRLPKNVTIASTDN